MSKNTKHIYAAIEGGGTKFVVGVGHSYQDCVISTIQTRSAHKTMAEVKRCINETVADGHLEGIGIGTFGPVVVDPTHTDRGRILNTPKIGWRDYNFVTDLGSEFGVPVSVQTDVGAAALSEVAERPNCRHLVYVTVGTGIGGGVFANDRLISGSMHPELGHIMLPRHPDDKTFQGACPFHDDCLEGLASGPAIKARWGASLSELAEHHQGHDIEAFYIGRLCANLVLHHAPEVIVLGGGVMNTPGLLAKVREHCHDALGAYIAALSSEDAMEQLISAPLLGGYSGLRGAFMLAANNGH